MKYLTYLLFFLLSCMLAQSPLHSQNLLKKLKDKAEDKVVNKVFGEDNSGTTTGTSTGTAASSGTETRQGRMQNTSGGGLVSTPPDVKKNLTAARSSFASGSYGDARYAARQALLGVEMEMGKQVLASLPQKVDGLEADPSQDRVTSTGIGFVGLAMERTYRSDEKELRILVNNDALLLSSVNVYLNAGYVSTDEPGKKVVQFQNYKSLLSYDDASGYTLNVPFGQSSMFSVQGINYSSEDAFMTAAGQFDIEKIKKGLGEK
ncbi:MAG: hypothetical protein ACPLXM_04425 [Bacteroidales bacterium]